MVRCGVMGCGLNVVGHGGRRNCGSGDLGDEGWQGLEDGRGDSLLGAALAGDEDADALEDLCGGAAALGQEDVGGAGTVEGVDSAGDDHGGEAGVELLGAAYELVAIHLGHDEVGEQEVEAAGRAVLDEVECLVRGGCGYDAVAACFEEELADGEDLFVVIDAKDALPGTHCSSLSAGAGCRAAWRIDLVTGLGFAGSPKRRCSKRPAATSGVAEGVRGRLRREE